MKIDYLALWRDCWRYAPADMVLFCFDVIVCSVLAALIVAAFMAEGMSV